MRNAEMTRAAILDASSKLFNVKGYKATSISDITSATGYTKGAIYGHFESKAKLEKESLLLMTNTVLIRLRSKIKSGKNVKSKMFSILDFFKSYGHKPPVFGGCPLLNASVEVDDNNPSLRPVVKGSLEMVHSSVVHILEQGERHGQLKKGMDKTAYASLLLSALEGGIMMAKITGENRHLYVIVDFLKECI